MVYIFKRNDTRGNYEAMETEVEEKTWQSGTTEQNSEQEGGDRKEPEI